MITAILVISLFNLGLQLVAVYRRHQTLKEQRKMASDNTSQTPYPLEDHLGQRTGGER